MSQARIYRGDHPEALAGGELFHEFPEPDAPTELDEPDEAAPFDAEAVRQAVLEEARIEAEVKVQQAYDEGLRRGTEAGAAAFLDRVGEAAQVLEAAAEAMTRAREEFLDSLEAEVVVLVRGMLERVLLRECAEDGRLIQRLARRALEALADSEEICLYLNPLDREVLEEQRVTLLNEFPAVRLLRIEVDAGIERGGCRAETRGFAADFQPSALLDNLMEDVFP